MNFEKYNLKQIKPDTDELREYLYECTSYTDKRCFVPISEEISVFLSDKNLSEMDEDQIKAILNLFGLLPEVFYTHDKVFYSNFSEITTPLGPLIVLERFGGVEYDFLNFMGEKIDVINTCNELHKISWSESQTIEDMVMLKDNSILVWFIGRLPSWAIFEYTGFCFLLKDAGSDLKGSVNPPEVLENIDPVFFSEKEMFNLVCRVPNEEDLRAYLYQLSESFFEFRNITTNISNDKLIDGKLNPDSLSIEEIRFLLSTNNVFPNRIYFFKDNFELMKKIYGKVGSLPYNYYPILFTNIHGVSFDEGGLIAMEFFGKQIYRLYSSSGIIVSDYCHDLELLSNGCFVSRGLENSYGFDVCKYNGAKKSFRIIEQLGDSAKFSFLPVLGDRDLIHQMFYPNATLWNRMNSFNLVEQKINSIIRNSEFWISSPRLVSQYKNRPELAILVLKRMPQVFNLLSDNLQNDKEFIIQALCEDCGIYVYLTDVFRKDKDVLFQALKHKVLDIQIIQLLPESYRNDLEFIMKILKVNGSGFEYISLELQNVKDVVMAALFDSSDIIKFIPANLKLDTEIAEKIKTTEKIIEEKEKIAADDLPF